MSPTLNLSSRTLAEALLDRARDRIRDPEIAFRLDRMRNHYVCSTLPRRSSISDFVQRGEMDRELDEHLGDCEPEPLRIASVQRGEPK